MPDRVLLMSGRFKAGDLNRLGSCSISLYCFYVLGEPHGQGQCRDDVSPEPALGTMRQGTAVFPGDFPDQIFRVKTVFFNNQPAFL